MRRDGDRRARTVVAARTARSATRSAALWGVLFGALAAQQALSYRSSFPTAASRHELVRSFGHNAGLNAVVGVARRLDTVGGWLEWRTGGLLVIVGAVWGLLAATRLLRREEDAGRWELLLAGRTTRRNATEQALSGLAAGWIVLWALTAAAMIAAGSSPDVGLSPGAGAFYAAMVTASAAMFLVIGAVTSQLAGTRRQANGLGAGVFAVCLGIRMVADSVGGLGWMRWLSPLGWVENLHPLTGAQPLALVPITVLVGAGSALAVTLAGRRDVGTGVLARRRAAHSDTRLLNSPAQLVVRLEGWVALGWITGLAALAALFGIVARSAATADPALNRALEEQVARLGGRHVTAAAAWIGYEFLYIAALVAFAAAGQIAAMRDEEADGHLDNLLARPLRRRTWVDGRLRFGTALVVAIGLAAGVGGWLGVAGAVGLTAMLQAGLNLMPSALFVLGLGTLLFGLVPRLAAPLLYALILWSFLIEVIGSSLTSNRLLLDLALFSHLGPVPAAGLNWTAIGVLTGLGALAALAGIAAFRRRDLAAA
jgi:ABC-2 type transport system permease protein